jgi:hypothetical protein
MVIPDLPVLYLALYLSRFDQGTTIAKFDRSRKKCFWCHAVQQGGVAINFQDKRHEQPTSAHFFWREDFCGSDSAKTTTISTGGGGNPLSSTTCQQLTTNLDQLDLDTPCTSNGKQRWKRSKQLNMSHQVRRNGLFGLATTKGSISRIE